MANELASIREGLGRVLSPTGAEIYLYPPFGGAFSYPALAIVTWSQDPQQTMGNSWSSQITVDLALLVSNASDEESYRQLVEFMEMDGARSIQKHIQDDRTLDGAADTCRVVWIRNGGYREFWNGQYTMADIRLNIVKSGVYS